MSPSVASSSAISDRPSQVIRVRSSTKPNAAMASAPAASPAKKLCVALITE